MNENKTNINWYPGHMAKTKREIKGRINLIDVVYEVIDARMPRSSKIDDIDDIIKEKPRVIIMTKYDLCDKNETDKFIKYYEDLGYKVVCINLLTDKISKILDISTDIMKVENKKRKAKGMKERPLRALVIGVPNAGKSTLINRLVSKKSVNVGNTPGVTKNISWIRINKDLELLDTPGILWPDFSDQERAHVLAAFSSIREEILDKNALAVFILKKLYEYYPDNLKERYGIDHLTEDFVEEFELIGKKRGLMASGGVVDYEKVATAVINDLKSGRLGKITLDRLD
ncbi:MAG: ribosome biogenesis GTPase YlqF [Bacilli bacterium]|nr:ribosome biogenesis GTPase YlqF [Bacilli bacterium]